MDRKLERLKEYRFERVQGRKLLGGQIKSTVDNFVQTNTYQISFVHDRTPPGFLAWTKSSSRKTRFFGPQITPKNTPISAGVNRLPPNLGAEKKDGGKLHQYSPRPLSTPSILFPPYFRRYQNFLPSSPP